MRFLSANKHRLMWCAWTLGTMMMTNLSYANTYCPSGEVLSCPEHSGMTAVSCTKKVVRGTAAEKFVCNYRSN